MFDIHPPLGKLTLYAVAKAAGYKIIKFNFRSLGRQFGELVYYPQRAFAALTGSFIPPVMYLTARALSLSFGPSFATAAMPLFDVLLCIESRLILTDSQLILYIQAAYLAAFLLWQTPRSTPRRYLFLVLTALTAAFALSTKWTAFVAPLLIAFISLTGIIFPHARLDLLEMGIAAVIAAVVYMGSFWIHFALLPRSGPGDAFMEHNFRATLIGSPTFNPKAPQLSFWSKFWYLNWEMLRANSAIETRHPWESKWYEWLYNARGILYSQERIPPALLERVYVIVNPVLTVITGVGVIVSVLYCIVKISQMLKDANKAPKVNFGTADVNVEEKKVHSVPDEAALTRQHVGVVLILFMAWCGNLFPYIGIKRCTFLYHVLPALQLASLMTGIMLNCLPHARGLRNLLCLAIVVSMAVAFYWWRPLTYGLHRPSSELEAMRLMPRWN